MNIFKEDSERMTKRSFLEWIEQRPGATIWNQMSCSRDFEKKYAQLIENKLPLAKRRLFDSRNAELFLQAADEWLEE